jgi:hypothetical protein
MVMGAGAAGGGIGGCAFWRWLWVWMVVVACLVVFVEQGFSFVIVHFLYSSLCLS